MKVYETIVILKPAADMQEIEKKVEEKIEDMVRQKDGKMLNVEKWGIRKLSYPIKKLEEGYYILFNYTTTPESVKEIDRFLRIEENVIRFLTVKIKKEALEKRLNKEDSTVKPATAETPVQKEA
ncbi:MAG: 30S ribosomal protein S6 [Candidatus Schekmanbacteria bacterium]|nr:MAG: 30S ribosomal protein S6 [Candidatus Schekmanbacteria bacterium]